MPKKTGPTVIGRFIQQMLEHVSEYPNPTAAAEAVAERNGVGAQSVRRWHMQAQADGGRAGASRVRSWPSKGSMASVRRLEEDKHSSPGSLFFAAELDPALADRRVHRQVPKAGDAVEPICRVLTQQSCQIAARTYRSWKCIDQQVAVGTLSDAIVMDKVGGLVWTSMPGLTWLGPTADG